MGKNYKTFQTNIDVLMQNPHQRKYTQGSNLALASLQNASSFSPKKLKLPSLAILASEYKSFSHQLISKLCINCLISSVDPDQPALMNKRRS